jgi:hypothetical protein
VDWRPVVAHAVLKGKQIIIIFAFQGGEKNTHTQQQQLQTENIWHCVLSCDAMKFSVTSGPLHKIYERTYRFTVSSLKNTGSI